MAHIRRFGMTRVLAVLAALVALAFPSLVLAKGASEATITGPGIDRITLPGEGQADGGRLMQLAQDAGFFPAVFVTSPNPMLTQPPTSDLGPRYTIEYTMPGPNNVVNQLRQDLYPYAQPEPVSYMEPGQTYFGTENTVGGWYISGSPLKDDLIAVGLPKRAPDTRSGFALPWETLATGLGLLACAVVVTLVLRSRRHAAPAQTR
jgi:hypothetical protein